MATLCQLRPALSEALSVIEGDVDLLETGIVDSLLFLQLVMELEAQRGSELIPDGYDTARLGRLSGVSR
jgi:hypothetical protein